MSSTQAITHDRHSALREVGDELGRAGRRAWLAALGAAGTVGEAGWRLASELVERGRELERKERPVIERRLREGGDRLKNLGRENAEKVVGLGREAGRRLEERVEETLHRFGVPSRDEVRELSDRIEQLTRKVEGLTAKS